MQALRMRVSKLSIEDGEKQLLKERVTPESKSIELLSKLIN